MAETVSDLLAVVTTLGDAGEARAMARALVERRLAACVQITTIESVYAWEGEICNDPEFRLLVKTTTARYAEVEAAILALHSYDLPAIHAYPVAAVYSPYGEWVVASTADDD